MEVPVVGHGVDAAGPDSAGVDPRRRQRRGAGAVRPLHRAGRVERPRRHRLAAGIGAAVIHKRRIVVGRAVGQTEVLQRVVLAGRPRLVRQQRAVRGAGGIRVGTIADPGSGVASARIHPFQLVAPTRRRCRQVQHIRWGASTSSLLLYVGDGDVIHIPAFRSGVTICRKIPANQYSLSVIGTQVYSVTCKNEIRTCETISRIATTVLCVLKTAGIIRRRGQPRPTCTPV